MGGELAGGEEARKLGGNHPKMKGQEAGEAMGGFTKNIEVEPAKRGRSKRQRKSQSQSTMFQYVTHIPKSSNKGEGGDGSGGVKVGATGGVVMGAKEETSQGSSEEPRDEKGYVGGFRVEDWDPGPGTDGKINGLTD